jgi:hypothetical protein
MTKALLAAFIALPLFAQSGVEAILERKLLAGIAEYDSKLGGAMGAAIIGLASGRATEA